MIIRPILERPNFIDRDANAITSELVALYEQLANKKLYPAQADRLFIDVIAYREMLIRTQIQLACEQNLLAFASGVMLDYLGDFFGVVRLDDETDEQLRERIRLAPESYATTGSRQAYIYHALSADSQIIDADALRGGNGDIYIHILTSDGVVSDELIQRCLTIPAMRKNAPCPTVCLWQEQRQKTFALSLKFRLYLWLCLIRYWLTVKCEPKTTPKP